jgi:hypothetical protein
VAEGNEGALGRERMIRKGEMERPRVIDVCRFQGLVQES